ncbi:hypothetical protein QR680_003654 [Steinernema hermaphroditum]|uniref:C3H1-type domain-containing protein n=1 Tax=Steinernema hermaphroditum TaxID=289476 RepID=A0AA39HL37_9BILA|nr:hypothetical protein QR680_003654 [Steinernema hermaphroditum]
MSLLAVASLLCLLASTSSDRVRRWGYPNPQSFVPYVPNNNIGMGYPTAYGLGLGYIRNGGGYGNEGYGYGGDYEGYRPRPAPPPRGFPLLCSNGGAHIGQCRLDADAICLALGGECINTACCTTPFYGGRPIATTKKPVIVEGEALRPKPIVASEVSGEFEPESQSESEAELAELKMIVASSRTERPKTATRKPRRRTTTTLAPITVALPSRQNQTDISLNEKVCSNGMEPIGPCYENNECPYRHGIESHQVILRFCMYDRSYNFLHRTEYFEKVANLLTPDKNSFELVAKTVMQDVHELHCDEDAQCWLRRWFPLRRVLCSIPITIAVLIGGYFVFGLIIYTSQLERNNEALERFHTAMMDKDLRFRWIEESMSQNSSWLDFSIGKEKELFREVTNQETSILQWYHHVAIHTGTCLGTFIAIYVLCSCCFHRPSEWELAVNWYRDYSYRLPYQAPLF